MQVLRAILLTGVITMGARAAQAETIYLTCRGAIGPDGVGTHSIDTEAKTADGIPAQVSATSVDWDSQGAGDPSGQITSISIHHHVDRVQGTITEGVTFHMGNGSTQHSAVDNPVACTAGPPPATRF